MTADLPLDEHAFVTTLERSDEGPFLQHGLRVPAPIVAALRSAHARRVVGTLVADHGHAAPVVFRRVLHDDAEGASWLRFGGTWLANAGLRVGDGLVVTLRVDPDPDAVDVPDELELALVADPEAREVWETLSAGRRRSLAHRVANARHASTRQRRADTLVQSLAAGDIPGPPSRRRAPQ